MPSSGRGVKPPTGTSRHKVRWMRLLSYLPDWIITIALAAVFFSLDYVEGYRRVFSINDTSLLHPFAEHERVPNTALYLIAILAPFVLQIVINLITIRSWWDFHNATLGLILSLALTGSITQFTKITVGRPRPDIISRCIPRAGSADPPLGLSDWTICTSTNAARLRDGFRSFPSGHSSLSFAGLGFLAFYLSGKLHLFDRRGHAGKAWLALTPLSGAALVAISRSMDYRHHWHDILVGSILGLVMSYFCYRQYYPALTSRYSHRPYAPRHTWTGTALSEVQDEDELGVRRHLRASSSISPDAHRAYRDEAGEDDEELHGTVPRTGAQDLSRTWEEGRGPISEGEARRVQENA